MFRPTKQPGKISLSFFYWHVNHLTESQSQEEREPRRLASIIGKPVTNCIPAHQCPSCKELQSPPLRRSRCGTTHPHPRWQGVGQGGAGNAPAMCGGGGTLAHHWGSGGAEQSRVGQGSAAGGERAGDAAPCCRRRGATAPRWQSGQEDLCDDGGV